MRSTAEPDPYGENPAAQLPELAGRVVYWVGFAKAKSERKRENPPIKDLIH